MNRVSASEVELLSSQEWRIARMITWGYVQKEIADKLNISIQTVAVHLRNIYRKLDIHKETDLARFVIFSEYGIADNFRKVIIVCFFLVLSVASVLFDLNFIRASRSCCAARCAKTMRAPRASRRCKSIKYSLITT